MPDPTLDSLTQAIQENFENRIREFVAADSATAVQRFRDFGENPSVRGHGKFGLFRYCVWTGYARQILSSPLNVLTESLRTAGMTPAIEAELAELSTKIEDPQSNWADRTRTFTPQTPAP